ncbi:predicted protein [Sclerotinia sclerotiorum 1980 UF-70]|uniref:Uncharacterized protein n=1 Tax=Sclerotinia sclerotiorum (strain ATCC 18683 / 1980 / Ss-1) TaxID=665079 RepID=A7F247_SCLS1|nr:predicted protein [Sclerotinia sclerotiorum 1980 UF-70]EDN95789.1 predicted protein [Sclerotinia sclerotiorum 1980 UF-70]
MPIRKPSTAISMEPSSESPTRSKSHHTKNPSYSSSCSISSRSLSTSDASICSFDSKRLEIMKTQTIEWTYEPASNFSETEKIENNPNTYHTWEGIGLDKTYIVNFESGIISPKKERWTKD